MRPKSDKKAPRWRPQSELLPELSRESVKILELLPRALKSVWPLSAKHRRQLPADIRDLSEILTRRRSELARNYWNSPGHISAYLYYFLPWNLVRLCRLLPGLPLGSPPANALLLDAASGPLTLPLALWICRPDLRRIPLRIIALDSSSRPLELGAALFAALGAIRKEKIWPLTRLRGPIEALARLAAPKDGESPWLACAANALNELDLGADPQARLERLLMAWAPLWQNGCKTLFIEPGTRLGGAAIMRLREAALDLGLYPQSPCVHANACPLYDPERSGLPSNWCHFVFSAQDAPVWLKNLSAKAGLFKTSLTLSPLLLSQKPTPPSSPLPCRVISQPFPVEGVPCRYGCIERGLALLPNSRWLVSGSLCLIRPARNGARDGKSGALIVEPAEKE